MAGTSKTVDLIWSGDARSAIKAVNSIASANDKTTKQLKEDADKQTASMDKVRESSGMLKDAFSSLAGMVGIAGVAFGLKDLAEGGIALQTQTAQLTAALRATGQEAGDTSAKLKEYAESLSTHGGFATTQNMAALTAFIRETHSASEAQNMLSLATNIARGRNMDLGSAQMIVARAYTGSVGRLQALLGPMVAAKEASVGLSEAHAAEIAQLQDQAQLMGKMGPIWLRQQEVNDHITAQESALAQMTDKHATATQVLAAAQQEFGGAAAAYANTTQGKMSDLKNSFQNLTEELGTALLPAMNKIVSVASSVAQWMAKNKTVVMDVALAVAGLTAAWGGLKIITGVRDMLLDLAKAFGIVGETAAATSTEGVTAATELTVAWDTFMTATIIGIVIVGLIELVEHWKLVSKIAVEVWHDIEGAAVEVWDWIKDHWPLLLAILSGPVGLAVYFIVDHFKMIEGAVMDVVHGIEHFFEGLWHGIVSGAEWMVHQVKGIMHDLGFGGSGIMSYLNPVGLIGHGLSALGLAHGGTVPRYMDMGGPVGTDNVPAWLSNTEGVVTGTGMQNIGGPLGLSAINNGTFGGLGGNIRINPSNVELRLDNRVLAQGVIQYALNQAARGPSSLVGGSLVTGAPGLPITGGLNLNVLGTA